MTDRPALAETIVNTLAEEGAWSDQPPPRGTARVVARVLAEHETATATGNATRDERLAFAEGQARAMAHAADTEKAEAKHWRERAEAAEARCALLEQALNDYEDRLAEKLFPMGGRCAKGHNAKFGYDLTELGGERGCVACERDAFQTEHERLRAALEELLHLTTKYEVWQWLCANHDRLVALAPSQEPTT